MRSNFNLFVIFLIIPFFSSFGQTIKGEVIDKETKESLPFVNISCIQQDTTVSIVHTDFDGKFSIPISIIGEYEIQFHYTGYEITKRSIIIKDDLDVSLGQVQLISTITELEGVTITAEKEAVNMTNDGISFNIEEGGGVNMEDIVSSMPSVTMDENGQVTSNGEQVVILVNGEESTLENPLEDIPMQLIDRVELLNNPPAEYTSATSAINIVLKDNVKLGNNAKLYFEGGVPEQLKVGANLSKSKDRWSTTINVRYFENKLPYENQRERLNYNSNKRTTDSKSENGLQLLTVNWSTSYAASVNDKLKLSINYNSKKNTSEGEEEELVLNVDENNPNPRMNYRTTQNYRKISKLQAQLNYDKHFLKEGKKIVTTLRWAVESYDQVNSNKTAVYYQEKDSWNYQNERLTERDRPTQYLYANIKYVHPFTPKSTLTAGFRNTTRIQTTSERFYNITKEGDEVDRGNGDQYTDYVNQKLTAYAQWKYKFFNNITLNVGSILENSIISSDVSNNENEFSSNNNFWVFNPNVSLNKKINKNWMSRASYSFRMNTPSDRALNPTINDNNPLFISSGNPNLDLQKSHKLVLDVTNHKGKISTRAGVFFRSTLDGVERIFENKGDTIYSTYANIVDKHTFGTNIYLQYKLNKSQSVTFSGDVYKDFFNTRTGDFPLEETMFNGKMTYKAKFFKFYRLRVTGYLASQTILYNGTMTPASGVDLSASRSISKGKGKIWMSLTDVFSTRKIQRTNISTTFESTYVVNLPSTVKLGFSWSFISI